MLALKEIDALWFVFTFESRAAASFSGWFWGLLQNMDMSTDNLAY